jgi:hypothetical protein
MDDGQPAEQPAVPPQAASFPEQMADQEILLVEARAQIVELTNQRGQWVQVAEQQQSYADEARAQVQIAQTATLGDLCRESYPS